MADMDALHQRGRALEDEFFHRVDEKLRAELRRKMQREEERTQLAAVTGFKAEDVLDHLLDAGFGTATIASLALVPTVFVAWADGSVTPQERQSVIRAALHHGLKDQPSAFQMLEGWLHNRPGQPLWSLWEEYVAALRQSLTPTLAQMLGQEILALATAVATASDNRRGVGKIVKEEQQVLDDIARAFA